MSTATAASSTLPWISDSKLGGSTAPSILFLDIDYTFGRPLDASTTLWTQWSSAHTRAQHGFRRSLFAQDDTFVAVFLSSGIEDRYTRDSNIIRSNFNYDYGFIYVASALTVISAASYYWAASTAASTMSPFFFGPHFSCPTSTTASANASMPSRYSPHANDAEP
ncbi:hypothetical protein FPV67DRAFT_1678849 [Lyophyllum atratum]|nr:hypothetical protein FPV67DRAFT_1678849 [Lyophyllum atratum]